MEDWKWRIGFMKYQSFIFNPSFSILHFQSSKSTLYVLRQIGMTLPYPKIFKALALPPLGNPAGGNIQYFKFWGTVISHGCATPRKKWILKGKAFGFWVLSASLALFLLCMWVRKSYLEGGIVTLLDNFRFLTLHLLKDKSR